MGQQSAQRKFIATLISNKYSHIHSFAATYPNNVGRIVLDGVMNGHEYYDGNSRMHIPSLPSSYPTRS